MQPFKPIDLNWLKLKDENSSFQQTTKGLVSFKNIFAQNSFN